MRLFAVVATRFQLVRGAFILAAPAGRSQGSRPDGDSIWFLPDDARPLRDLGAKPGAAGQFQLRFEGIDALEVHYEGRHQDWTLATAARNRLLELAGFHDITWRGTRGLTVRTSVPDHVPGYIATAGIDSPRDGRPVSFAFAGAPEPTRTTLDLDGHQLRRSLNFRLLREGLVYPMLYTGLAAPLRRVLAREAARARLERRGLWRRDTSLGWTSIRTPERLDRLVMWPKLWRRLVKFIEGGGVDLREFPAWLRAGHAEDDVLRVAGRREATRLREVIGVRRDAIRLLVAPDTILVAA